ncbi:prephenate dehydrogenase [Spirosoma utsteinense]|uniref:Prephenate dehydrogenase n=1 Tax=Spirosoma utsteinense TaxID=2585773 RepID=A0ABR6WAK4_9BACT|nr:prephenate dehydrogenase [Spirosoma utsteinense]MBC3787812.1 prephenate dehydrogenase [Spirosoma utsteinense]MBC3793599.1 prephenate dehydrogenase [Spirosoma utsteinense]
MTVSIIGIGLLGGSFALAIREKYPKMRFIGVDSSPVNGQLALAKGIVDEVMPLAVAVSQSTLVVLATPVNIIMELLPMVLNQLPAGATVVDLGSTKGLICAVADTHPRRNQFVAAHPMAGTENSGPGAAFRELLSGKNLIICDREKSHADSLTLTESLFRDVGMKLFYMSPQEHDLHLAYVSHLSHISAFALGLTVLEKEKDEQAIFDMASTGFSSTVRLAKSSPQMWAPIFDQNRENVSDALAAYIEFLQQFKQVIDDQNVATSLDFMQRANVIRRVLDGIEKR